MNKKTYAKMMAKGLKVRTYGNSKKGLVKLNIFYGFFVEYGTKHADAKPFMRPTVEKSKTYAKTSLKSIS